MLTKNKFSSFPHVSHEHMDILMKCFSICSACSKMCIKENHAKTAILCADCADVCSLAIKLHSSDSEFSTQIFDLCSEVCARCAEECAKNSAKHCQECSEICQACSAACKTD